MDTHGNAFCAGQNAGSPIHSAYVDSQIHPKDEQPCRIPQAKQLSPLAPSLNRFCLDAIYGPEGTIGCAKYRLLFHFQDAEGAAYPLENVRNWHNKIVCC
jgi:hypothetical protein